MQTLETINQQIEQVKKQIIAAGDADTSRLEIALRKLRQEEEDLKEDLKFQQEVAEVKIAAAQRMAWQSKVRDLNERVKRQAEAIDKFLPLRDSLTSLIKQVIEMLPAVIAAQQLCFKEFRSPAAFKEEISGIPSEYLSKGVTCPLLAMGNTRWELDLSQLPLAEEFGGWRALVDDIKIISEVIPPADPKEIEDLGLTPEDISVSSSCIICQHPERAAIEKALAEGRTLREIEASFKDASKSSLSRHNKHWIPENPTAPAPLEQTAGSPIT